MNSKSIYKKDAGFTVIELTLAMSLMSILLMILILSSMQLISVYSKGLTLKRADQSARTISTEMQASLKRINAGSIKTRIQNGHTVGMCLGSVSYVWSYYGNASADRVVVNYDSADSNGSTVVGFAKVSGADVCTNPSSVIPRSASKEMIADGLVIRDPTSVTFIAGGSAAQLVNFQYTISTDDSSGVIYDGSRSACQGGKEGDFCALNTFLVTAYARGGV